MEALPGTVDELIEQLMGLLIKIRADARKNKNFSIADRVRDGVGQAGIVLEDRSDGTDWTSDGSKQGEEVTSDLMEAVIAIRAEARTTKDFATADQVRDALSAAGVVLEDRSDGTDWTRA